MAATVLTLLRLRFRLLGNTLSRSPWLIVGTVLGGLYGLGLLGLLIAGLVAARAFLDVQTITSAVVVGGSLLVVGWAVGPLLRAGADDSLDPARFRHLPVERRRLLLAATAAGALGIPGIVTGIAALGTVIAWSSSIGAALAAVPAALLGLATCVVVSRLVSTLASRLAGSRRFTEIVGILIFIPLVLLGPILLGFTAALPSLAELPGMLAPVLGWTPLGAAWAIPGDVAAGAPLLAVVRAVLAAGFVVAAFLLWELAVRSGEGRQAATGGTRRVGLGLFGRAPASPAGAVAARALQYWIRDPRYARSAVVAIAFPALFLVLGTFGGSPSPFVAAAAAAMMALSGTADVSYDGSAFALHVAKGVRGRDDRAGRAAALLIVGAPIVLVVALGAAALGGEFGQLPAALGLSLGLLLAGAGVGAVSSALAVMPVPAAGDNPFKSAPGSAGISFAVTFGSLGSLLVVSLPTIGLAITAAILGPGSWAGWATLGVGLALGGAMLIAGVIGGGRILDRRGPELLARIQAFAG